MDRVKIKRKAREMIKNNLFDLWKPLLYILAIEIVLGMVIGAIGIKPHTYGEVISNFVVGFLMAPIAIGVYVYLLKFVRKRKYTSQDIFSQYKNFIPIVLINFLVGFFVTLGTCALIIPGIILALGYSMVSYLVADGSLDIWGTLKESRRMMKGYKWNYFVFNLSFLGWLLLGVISLGVVFIYVIPYFNIANTLYYEELRKNKIKKDD